MKKYWYAIYDRGLETVAVWNTRAATFVFGEVTAAAHAASVNLLQDQIQAEITAGDDVDTARQSRDTKSATLSDICTRACDAILGSLPPGNPILADVADVCRVRSQSQNGIVEKARRLISLWLKVNAYRATLAPAQTALLVGGTDVAAVQSMLGNVLQLLQNLENKLSMLKEKNTQVRTTADLVDGNNKRWLRAWKGQFPKGSPQREALSQITTSSSTPPALPGQAVFLNSEVRPNQVVRLRFDAPRATKFKVLHRSPGSSVYTVLAEGLTTQTFEHTAQPPGSHSYKVVPSNSTGEGAESLPLEIIVAQQLAA